MGASDTAIKDTDVELAGRSNNNTDNEFDASVLDMSDAAIKDMDANTTFGKTKNNIDAKIDVSIFIGETISKTDAKLNAGEIDEANIIVKKEICESNFF